ncbi:NADH dehydrogenase [ubiquinone] 1 alpha subcomplex subunit 8-B-like [Chlorella sorokiniana]|uniref:NADH dehydrogenase [ubiquinone] 1 alpha subcomplex subunit 8-B-like n=1 Tax=Chlorella sorokiniana TaxID=3076 RepID=A0A2P6TTB8_CHLSO|nr:NADH dehydrogenase [ubiquinone] 1 alpha subcomplex subunit 8-B-like [Chlorella sorokiniana]|eukprot:PRW57307.1 NADH dehydrogenase [ubiquinone] 1 alpha subcomplex subunit 8-B-like [Chlorella sorokiniana]
MAAEGQAPPPTSAVLMSLSKHIAVRCSKVNKAYMDCKANDANPEKCLAQGDAVTSCVIDLLKEVNAKCPQQLKAYYECMDYYSNTFTKCRKEQKDFEEACPVS